MLIIGPHISIAKGFVKAITDVIEMGGNTFQFFSRNPRGSNFKLYSEKAINEFQHLRKIHHFGPLLAHSPYTMNLASATEEVYEFAKNVIREDVARMEQLEIEYFNFHPGSHVGEGIEKGIERIILGIDQALTGSEGIAILLETMSGKGTEIGFEFEHLARIIEGSKYTPKLGICMDLCHIFASGYDIVNDLDGVLDHFNQLIGLNKIKAIHLNDSAMPFGSNKDRHTPVGMGEIGLEAIINFMSHPCIRNLPFYLETPLDNEGHKKEISMITNELMKIKNKL